MMAEVHRQLSRWLLEREDPETTPQDLLDRLKRQIDFETAYFVPSEKETTQ
jgi:hypothetical protein